MLSRVAAEAKRLHDQGVTIIIALGHAGLRLDKEIAKIQYIDIVVGGREEVLLYTGNIAQM